MTDTAVQEQGSASTTEQHPGTQLATKPEAPVSRTGQMGFGLAPSTIDEAWRLAGILAKSKMVPKNYFGEPEDILVAMLYGNDLGLPPMAALQSVGVINGRPGVYGDGFLGVIQSKPAYLKHKEYYELSDGSQVKSLPQAAFNDDETKAVSMFWRRGNPDPFVQEFSIGAAKRAKLWGKQGPWSDYPARQLMWRARSFAGRDGFAAELRGIKMVEELLDAPDDIIDQAPIATAPAEPIRRSAKQLQELATTEPASGEPEAPAATATAIEPQAASEPAAPAKPAGAGKTAAVSSGPGQITKNVRITDTCYVEKPKAGGAPYYEIKGVVMDGEKPTVGHTWITPDEQLYRIAASCEGSDTLLSVTWHMAKQPSSATTSKDVKVITGLQAK